MAASKNAERQEEYLHTVYEPDAEGQLSRHLIDIVFVHGLNPRSKPDFANATWTHKNGNFWPTQQLPRRVPAARILIFSYNSQVAWDTNENGIQAHANNLLDRLSGARKSTQAEIHYNVPIIFVAHSLGGLVIKQALVTAKNDNSYADLRKATYGLVFFAVPHQGGRRAGLATIAKNIVLSLTGDAKNDITESLKSNSLFQENQAAFFKHQLEDYQIVSVYENKPTKIKKILGMGITLVIVDEKSATLGLPGPREKLLTVNSDHSGVCKFEGDDDKFEPVKRAIGTLAVDAIAREKKITADRSRVDIYAQENFQNFLHSLHFPSMESRQEEIADAHKETFQWIFGSGDAVRPWTNFVEWLKTGRGIYWITGKAGSGKSTLMSYICQDLRTMDALGAWAGTNVSKLLTPKFFFWNPGETMQKSSVGLLRSLLYQIFHEHPEVTPLPENNEPRSDWTEKRLSKVFNSIAYNLSRSYRVCFFIDGLDEFNGDHDALIEMFQELVRHVNIKVVLSSRPHRTFDRAFGSGAMLRLQDLTRDDIKKFVSDELLACPGIQFIVAREPQTFSEVYTVSDLIDDIVLKSNGVFLWVNLVVKDQIRGIKDEDSLEQLEERLRILPSGLEELYAHMLNNIQKVHRKVAAWFFQFALFKDSETLLDFTLAAYEPLDHDLGSSADFPSETVLSRCEPTRRRIITTCAGLLEVHEKDLISEDSGSEDSGSEDSVSEDSVSEDSVSEDPGSEDSIRGDSTPEDSNIRVTFLHRTVADFLAESDQGKDFLGVNTPPNRNVFWMWVKVLVARIRMFGFTRVWHTRRIYIEDIMAAAVNAEDETGVAQIAVCDYIDIAMKILYQERDNHSPSRHWCLEIYERATSRLAPEDLQQHLQALRDNQFSSASNEVKGYSFSRPVSESPVDYLGFAASCGLKFYVEQQMKLLTADHRSCTASYLLYCVINSMNLTYHLIIKRRHRILELICTLLEYCGNPNIQAFGSTIWGQFLALTFRGRHLADENAWTTILKSFLRRGADTKGILGTESYNRVFDVDDDLLQILSDASLRYRGNSHLRCCYRLRINASVPTLIRYCLGDSPISKEMVSTCMEKGALPYSKFTEITIGLKKSFGAMTGYFKSWVLSEQQSDRLLDAYERYIVPTAQPSPSAQLELKRQILLLYNELSAREPDHSRYLNWFASIQE